MQLQYLLRSISADSHICVTSELVLVGWSHYGSYFPDFFACLAISDWIPDIVNSVLLVLDMLYSYIYMSSFVLGYNEVLGNAVILSGLTVTTH